MWLARGGSCSRLRQRLEAAPCWDQSTCRPCSTPHPPISKPPGECLRLPASALAADRHHHRPDRRRARPPARLLLQVPRHVRARRHGLPRQVPRHRLGGLQPLPHGTPPRRPLPAAAKPVLVAAAGLRRRVPVHASREAVWRRSLALLLKQAAPKQPSSSSEAPQELLGSQGPLRHRYSLSAQAGSRQPPALPCPWHSASFPPFPSRARSRA